MYRFPLELVLLSGQQVRGTAVDVKTLPQRHEVLVLEQDGEVFEQDLELIVELKVLKENPHFSYLRLQG